MSAHPTQQTQPRIGLTVAGYVFALILPLIGAVIGLVAMKKHDGEGTNHGRWIVMLAGLSFIAGVVLLRVANGAA